VVAVSATMRPTIITPPRSAYSISSSAFDRWVPGTKLALKTRPVVYI
jgi:hypothetical protein